MALHGPRGSTTDIPRQAARGGYHSRVASDDEEPASASAARLPDFADPPVDEVVFAAAFEPIESLHAARVGLVWRDVFAEDYPEVREKGPVVVQFERFGPRLAQPTVSFQAVESPPMPRLWLLTPEGTELLQIQRDWFARNWRRTRRKGLDYPRYPALRELFERDARRFLRYVTDQGWGEVKFTQCELTYVNHVDLGQLGLGPGDVASVLGAASIPTNDPFLPGPELVQSTWQYLIGREGEEPKGRLYVTTNPAFRRKGDEPILVLTMSAKGPPGAPTLEGVLAFMDLAREWIVKGFVNITRPEMHQAWGRSDRGE